jgi:hemolysin III
MNGDMAAELDHYPSVWARRADLIVHLAGLTLALFGGGLALGLAVSNGMLGKVAAVSIYALGLIAMLVLTGVGWLVWRLARLFGRPDDPAEGLP